MFRPFIQVGGGAAQVDAKIQVDIIDPQFVPECTLQGRSAGEGCLVRRVNAWRKAGTVFGTAGLGALIATGENAGIVLEGRGMFLFPDPTSGIAISGARRVQLRVVSRATDSDGRQLPSRWLPFSILGRRAQSAERRAQGLGVECGGIRLRGGPSE